MPALFHSAPVTPVTTTTSQEAREAVGADVPHDKDGTPIRLGSTVELLPSTRTLWAYSAGTRGRVVALSGRIGMLTLHMGFQHGSSASSSTEALPWQVRVVEDQAWPTLDEHLQMLLTKAVTSGYAPRAGEKVFVRYKPRGRGNFSWRYAEASAVHSILDYAPGTFVYPSLFTALLENGERATLTQFYPFVEGAAYGERFWLVTEGTEYQIHMEDLQRKRERFREREATLLQR